jgi:hypothetical protein
LPVPGQTVTDLHSPALNFIICGVHDEVQVPEAHALIIFIPSCDGVQSVELIFAETKYSFENGAGDGDGVG